MPRGLAASTSSRTGSRIPLTFDTCVSDRTRVRSVSAATKGSMSSWAEAGWRGTATLFTVIPNLAARTSHATLLVGWFSSQITTSSDALSGTPLLMVLLDSLVLRTIAISSGVTPS